MNKRRQSRRLYTYISKDADLNQPMTQVLNRFIVDTILLKNHRIDATESLFKQEQVYINGYLKTDGHQKIVRNCQLHFFIENKTEKQIDNQLETQNEFSLSEEHIAYEDDDIVVLNKPTGLPTQATFNPAENHLFNSVRSYYTEPSSKRLAYIGVHHRLDRDTSGLVLMSKNKQVNKSIADQFKNHQVKKTYQAIIHSETDPPDQWRIENLLVKKETPDRKLEMVSCQTGGLQAITEFNCLKKLESKKYLIEARPLTGRTHQIRVHLSEDGKPIFGDRMYAPDSVLKASDRLMLHATKLELKHPKTHEDLVIAVSGFE